MKYVISGTGLLLYAHLIRERAIKKYLFGLDTIVQSYRMDPVEKLRAALIRTYIPGSTSSSDGR